MKVRGRKCSICQQEGRLFRGKTKLHSTCLDCITQGYELLSRAKGEQEDVEWYREMGWLDES